MQIKTIFKYLVTIGIIGLSTNVWADGCNFNIPPLNFGIYSIIQDTPDDSSNQLQITCQTATSVTIKMGAGQSGSFVNRYMTDANQNQLKYNIFMDSQRTVIFGDGNGGTNYYNGVNITSSNNPPMPIYGRLFKNQNIPAGNYFDTLSLDISF